jgi:hypothetical protein
LTKTEGQNRLKELPDGAKVTSNDLSPVLVTFGIKPLNFHPFLRPFNTNLIECINSSVKTYVQTGNESGATIFDET